MKILMINAVCGITSTGRICVELADKFAADGHEVKIAYGRIKDVPEQYRHYAHLIGSDFSVKLHGLKTRFLDGHGFGSKLATRRFLRWAEEYKPDLVWLHNLHGYYINIEMLFRWIKMHPEMQVKWTLHDCWALTGHCSFFSYIKCDKWKTNCHSCPQKKAYPASMADRSKQNYLRKKAAFTGVENLSLITPSHWLANLVRESYLKDYPVEVVYNTINNEIFRPTPGEFRRQNHLDNKIIVLGVASTWEPRKGLNDFYSLRAMLDDRYAIVLVGLTDKQIQQLPEGILGIRRTNSPRELAEIYTAADVFVNPSREETFGMTTVEAKACGTEAIVYRGTACEEIVGKMGGIAVEQNVDALCEAIHAVTACK